MAHDDDHVTRASLYQEDIKVHLMCVHHYHLDQMAQNYCPHQTCQRVFGAHLSYMAVSFTVYSHDAKELLTHKDLN